MKIITNTKTNSIDTFFKVKDPTKPCAYKANPAKLPCKNPRTIALKPRHSGAIPDIASNKLHLLKPTFKMLVFRYKI